MNFNCFFNDTATTEIYTYLHTLSLHDALPIYNHGDIKEAYGPFQEGGDGDLIGRVQYGRRGAPRLRRLPGQRSEEHKSELQSLMRISYAVFCLKKKNTNQ